MIRFYSALCLAVLCNNVTTASATSLEIEHASGIFSFIDYDGTLVQFGNLNGTEGSGSLVLSLPDDSSESLDFELTTDTQNVLLTHINSDRVLQIAESLVVNGKFSNGIYIVNSFQYSWDSCETVQGNEGCDSFIGFAPQTAILTQTGNVFSLATSTYAYLTGYSISEPFLIERQLEFTPVPVPAAIWFLASALATLRGLREVPIKDH